VSEELPQPWHDTERHHCVDGNTGPVVPVSSDRPHKAASVSHVRCAACGESWKETDVAKIARIWWSRGAWDGSEVKP